MENIVQGIVESKVKGIISVNPSSKDNSGINWNDFNFPPFLGLVHFSLAELKGTLKSFVLIIYLSYLVTISVMIINRMS